jgi:DNA invertase Pin-like site-specific DNA recombinase
MRQAIALLRVSTEAQAAADRGSLPAQRAEIARIAARHELELVEWVELAGVSGAKVLEEPRFAAVLERLAEPGIAGVVVVDFDRLFRRGRFEDYAILDRFADTGSVIFSGEGVLDPAEDTGGLLGVLRGELGGMERRAIARRANRVKEELRKAGRHVQGPSSLPLAVAYRLERDEAGGVRPVWSYTWPEAGIVRRLFAEVLAGERNFARLARTLGLDRTRVKDLLRNPIYAGRRRYALRRIGKRCVPRTDPLEVTVFAEPLVPPADFEAVQEILDGRRRRGGRSRGDGGPAVFYGLARCALCGAPLYVSHLARWGWKYRCSTATKRGGCPTGQLGQAVVDQAGELAVARALADPEVLAVALAAVLEPAPVAELDPELGTKRLEELRRERERVVTSFERGLRTLTDAEGRIRSLERQEASLRRDLEAGPGDTPDPEEIAAAVASTFASWPFLQLAEKRRLLAAGVEAVLFERAGIAAARCTGVVLRLLSLPGRGHRLRSVGTHPGGILLDLGGLQ